MIHYQTNIKKIKSLLHNDVLASSNRMISFEIIVSLQLNQTQLCHFGVFISPTIFINLLMGFRSSECSSTRIKMMLFVFFILCTVLRTESLVVERKKESTMISSNEELNEKQIGPMNQYELLNSFPSLFSTDKRIGKENLLLVYDCNM